MADGVVKVKRGPSIVSWLALLIACIALVLGWIAYDRTGADLEDQIQTQVEKGLNAAEDATQNATDAIDAGPDGVDEDDTDVPSNTPAQ